MLKQKSLCDGLVNVEVLMQNNDFLRKNEAELNRKQGGQSNIPSCLSTDTNVAK
jgi:hypothetical protein